MGEFENELFVACILLGKQGMGLLWDYRIYQGYIHYIIILVVQEPLNLGGVRHVIPVDSFSVYTIAVNLLILIILIILDTNLI